MAFLALCNLLRSAFSDDGATTSTSLGSEVYDVVGTLDDIHIVLHDQNGVATGDETVEGSKEMTDVVEMQARGGFVEDEQRGFVILLGEIVCQFQALILTARERGSGLAEGDVAQSDLLEGRSRAVIARSEEKNSIASSTVIFRMSSTFLP